MNPRRSPPPGDAKEEVSASIETLPETGQRLEELTGGQVDTVANGDGRTFLLRRVQDRVRHSEAARQAAILKPPPSHIALLDIEGLIITVNEAWRQFTGTNVIHGPGHGIGVNYLEICDSARGDDSSLAHQVAEGIRSVLGGGVKSFSIEYPCHSPTEQRWFLLTVTPLADDHPNGAGVLHLNITERKRGEEELLRFAAATDATADAIYLVDRSSMCFVHVNDAACRMQNQTREELLALEPWVAFSTSRAELERTYDSVIAGGVDTNPLEMLRRRKDGSPVWLELRRHAQHSGNRWMIFTLERDITERKRAEDALARVNRVLAVLSGVNSAIVRFHTRQELFDEVCRIAVDHGAFAMAWIGLLDPVTLDVTAVSWAGKDAESLARMKATARSDLPEGRGAMGKAIRAKKPVFNNDITAEDRLAGPRRQECLKRGYRSLIALPLLVDGEVAGNLSLYAREPDFYNQDEIKLLSELAGNISFALEHISRQQKLEKLSRIHAVSSGINSILIRVRNRQELFQESCRIAVEDGKFPFAWIGSLDPATQDVTPIAWAGESAEELTRAKSSARDDIQAGKGAVGRAIRERLPVFNNDITVRSFGGPRLKEILRLGFRSQITLPLFENQTVVGTLTMYARELDFFDEEELRLLTELAGDISFALENISRQQKLEKLSRIRAVSSEINAAIVRIRERKTLLEETCRIASEHGKFEMIWIGAIDRGAQQVQPIAWTGFSEETVHSVNWASISSSKGALGEAIRTRKPSVRNDIEAELPGGNLRKEALKQGCRSSVCLPLVIDDSAVAAIALFATGIGFFDEEELALLNEVAGNVSFALEHIEKEEKIARLSRIQAVMGSINSLIVRVRDRQELFDEACRIAVEHGGFGIAWIGTFDPQTLEVVPVAHAGLQDNDPLVNFKSSAGVEHPLGRGVVGRAIRERSPVFVNDLSKEPGSGERRKDAIRRGYYSRIALPLLVDNGVVGVMVLFARERDFFNEEELKLLSELAGDISFALEHISRQQKLEKLSRIRAVSSEINAAIIRIHDREALLRETCRIADKYGKFELVWVATLDHEKQSVQPEAWTGFSPDAAHAVSWSSISAARGTLGEAILTRKPAVRNDIQADLPVGKLRQEALQKGCVSTVCLPLVVDDNVVALVVLFAPGVGFFDEEELALLNEVAADVSLALQAIEKQEKLEYLSYYDVLTGLPNRALFVDRLSQQMRSRVGEQQMVALILLDVERFRNINESLGHRGGDELLNSIAQRLGHAFNGKDYLARISSNGFGAIVRGMKDAAGVIHLVENEVFSCFKQPFVVSDRELRVSVKAGIAMFPVDGENAEILFRNAESALKRVRASSDRYLFYAADMNAQAAHAIALETRLRKAVDARQFVLHYQPKIELATGRICGLEALIRWNDPATGLVPPMKFIPILEETGMILEVGAWALRQALSDHAQWAAQGLQPPRIAVNVSQIQLRHAGFVASVANATRAHASGAAGLALEITESLFMENFEECVDKLKAIHDMGIEIAVDDFGTGYSSLSYISRLPVDALKIDRSFVVKMASDPGSMSIVSMVITLAHTLNLKVVAEGVETEEQSNMLKLLRCDEAQGYLFAKPLPGESIEALLRERSGAKPS